MPLHPALVPSTDVKIENYKTINGQLGQSRYTLRSTKGQMYFCGTHQPIFVRTYAVKVNYQRDKI